jgi:site-specific DNA recombinase
LARPGLEALRDLAAQGHIEAVLAYSPDRLSRKYAYQVLLAEEFNRQGVELVFLKAPSSATPEDQMVVQFQGMIAEYERAQIIERSRRGKRHRAKQGAINVLSGAPYGYRYVKKSDNATAYYEVIETEADVVRLIFDNYTKGGLSINAIARLLNDRRIPTRTGSSRWERSTVWAMLRNPAYQGKACFGKTERAARKKITRPLRQRCGHSSRCGAHRERPRAEWIEIAVPALVSEATFALAQEQLEKNKRHSPRRTVAPSLLQGMLVCQQCGYALYRSSAQTSKRKLYYYRCLGSDAYRHLHGPVCTNRPVRQDYLDQFVWQEIVRILEEPELIMAEIQRRLEAAQKSDPVVKREQSLHRELTRLEASTERLLTAYQENLLTLAELRRRMPELRKQQQAIQSELTSRELAASDQSRYLRLTQTLTEFRQRLQAKSETMEIPQRQKLLRLLVKEILVGTDTITIRHSLPIAGSEPPSGGPADGPKSPGAPSGTPSEASYLLRSGSDHSPLWGAVIIVPATR